MTEEEIRSQFRTSVDERLNKLETGHSSLREAIEANTVITKNIETNTSEIVEYFVASKGFFTVTKWIGKSLIFIVAVGTAIAAAWAALHLGGK